MKISVDGLVIWETKTGEADRVITILTGRGLLTAYAKGTLRPRNHLTSPTAMLSYSNFELYSGRNMYHVDDAMAKERFLSLFTDVGRYAFAAYFCELMKFLAPIDDDASEYLALTLNALYLLNEGKKDPFLVKPAFELRLMLLSGYKPDLDRCAGCGTETGRNVYFDLTGGIWYCARCADGIGKTVNLSPALFLAMRHAVGAEPEKIFSFEMPGKSLRSLNRISERYVTVHIDRSLPTLDFLRSIADETN